MKKLKFNRVSKPVITIKTIYSYLFTYGKTKFELKIEIDHNGNKAINTYGLASLSGQEIESVKNNCLKMIDNL